MVVSVVVVEGVMVGVLGVVVLVAGGWLLEEAFDGLVA